MVLDCGKAWLAVCTAQWLAPHNGDLAIAAAATVIIGHCFPVWLGFRGGKGVACALGVFIALLPWAATLIILGMFLLAVSITRFVSLGSIVGACAFPFLAFYCLRGLDAFQIVGLVGMPVIVVAKHHENIRRLLAGTESRIGSSRKVPA